MTGGFLVVILFLDILVDLGFVLSIIISRQPEMPAGQLWIRLEKSVFGFALLDKTDDQPHWNPGSSNASRTPAHTGSFPDFQNNLCCDLFHES
jgi:hypothetical protein